MTHFYQLIGTNFRHTSKNLEGGGGQQNKIKRKNVFPKKGVELTTFDDTAIHYIKNIIKLLLHNTVCTEV